MRMSFDWMESAIEESVRCISGLRKQREELECAAGLLIATLGGGGKVLTLGNGGSAAEAMHMSEELIGRFRDNRRSYPAVALVSDGTALTCIGNDFGFDRIFSRQVEGLGNAEDLLVVFSTSGKGANLRLAVEEARGKGLRVLLILGRDGGALAGTGDCQIVVPGEATERIQEAHQVVMHLLLDAVERWTRDEANGNRSEI